MTEPRTIFCCGCQREVMAVLKTGKDLHPGRQDLAKLPFWQCPTCGNWVGCYRQDPKTPHGVIPTPEVRRWRLLLSTLLNPLWQSGKISHQDLVQRMNKALGQTFYLSETRTREDCRRAYRIGLAIKKDLESRT